MPECKCCKRPMNENEYNVFKETMKKHMGTGSLEEQVS
jgi:hypothetical protein